MQHRIDMWRYKEEIDALSAQTPKQNAVLFYGSSTIARWDGLEQAMQPYLVNKRGFGGSTSDEGLYHYERLVLPCKPCVVVWYFGDNEPVCGYSVEETWECYTTTWERLKQDFPQVKIVVIETKTSPARQEYSNFVLALNSRVKAFVRENSGFYDVPVDDICRKDGKFIVENYYEDLLHFGEKGYDLLGKKVKKILDEIK